jgi:hypothetical protein
MDESIENDIVLTNESEESTAPVIENNEVVDVAGDEDVVEVKDEAKPADKPKRFVRTQDDEEVSDEELAKYSEDVKKRIKRLTWRSQNEKRGREQAERDRDEAVRIAQVLLEEKRKAEALYGEAQQASTKASSDHLEIALATAQQQLKDAFEAFDGEGVAKANAELARLMVQKERLADAKPAKKNEETTRQLETSRVDSQQTPREQPQARPDPLAEAWAKRNSGWFQLDGYGRPHNEETAFALKVHETLLGAGVHPILNAADYYRKLDATMKANFPEHFGEAPPKPAEKPAPKTTVSGVTRSPSGSVKVKLTESQMRLASNLGISPEDYARSLAELRSN